MAKIFYSINGQGMGHVMRSKPIIEYLSRKHSLSIFASGKAYRFLRSRYPVHHLWYYHLIYINNTVNIFLTFLLGTLQLPFLWIYHSKVAYSIVKEKPDLIISDFEPSLIYWGWILHVPVINIDNQHTLYGTKIVVPPRYHSAYKWARAAIRFVVPYARTCISTTFFYPQKTLKNLYLVPPILRNEIRSLKSRDDHVILVYQTSKSNLELLHVLEQIPEQFIVYGFGKKASKKNIEFKELNEKTFYNDLARCKAVICNSGFTLLSEALYLRKPMFCTVIGHQFEQIVNGMYIERLGYGKFSENVKKNEIVEFLKNLKQYKKNLMRYRREDNRKLFSLLDQFIREYSR